MKESAQSRSAASSYHADNVSILVRLRNETQSEHSAIEQVLGITNGVLSKDGYRRILECFYGYYSPLEEAIFGQREDEPFWSILKGRRKVVLLEQDLQVLGVDSPRSLPMCGQIPQLNSTESVFGSLYVIEGATLGGQLISRHIQQVLNVNAENGGRFFQGYGPCTGEMWHAFRMHLDSFAVTRGCQDEIIAAALETFVTLRNWFSQGVSS